MKSLKRKFRYSMLIIVTVVILLTTTLFFRETWNIVDLVSKNYAALFNNQIVGEVNTYINREIGITEKLANTQAIKNWLLEPESEEKKELAFKEIPEFNEIFYDHNSFLIPMLSQEFYYFDGTAELDKVVPEGQIEVENELDTWYFDFLKSNDQYRFKIDRDRFLDSMGLWINMKTYDENKVVGVVGTQLGLEGLIEGILILHEKEGVQTLVVDQDGTIQLGKLKDEFPMHEEVPPKEGNKTEVKYRSIYEVDPDFPFNDVNSYFEMSELKESYVFTVDTEDYQYGAIAPIVDSNWYLVTFYDRENILSNQNLLMYVLMVIGVILLLGLAVNTIIQRMLITPFGKLMNSTVLKEGQREAEIYGLERDDEFGELARSIDNMSRQLVESIPVGLFILNKKGEFQYGNPYFCKQFKCQSSLAFKKMLEEYPEKIFGSRSVLQSLVDRMIKKSTFLTLEIELKDFEDNPFWAEIQIKKTSRSEDEWEYEGILINVQKKKEEERRLIKEASRDGLTGLYNRNYFNRMIEEEMNKAERYHRNLTLVLFDLDHFKEVNDTFGHQKGDDVLIQTAKIAKKILRQSDILARWGGEEFILLMPDSKLREGIMVAERIRKELENFEHPVVGRVTGSFGVSEREKGEELLSWFTRTDQAMYEAKESGRNRVCCEKSARGDEE